MVETDIVTQQEEVVEGQAAESLYTTVEDSLMASLRLLAEKATWRMVPLEPCTWKRREITPTERTER